MKSLKAINNKIVGRAKEEDYPYFLYALFQIISNPIYYLLWFYSDHSTYDSFAVRSFISVVCIPLLLQKHWSPKFKNLLPYYWHATILYSLPFFFTFMLLKNNFSYEWALNSLTGFVLCIIFIDASLILLFLPVGIGLGIACYDLSVVQPFYPLDRIQPVLITYSSIILFGKLFLMRNGMVQREKQRTLQMQAGAIAHEMRTPLFALSGIGHFLKTILPSLIKDRNTLKPSERNGSFSEKQLSHAIKVPDNIEKVTRQAFSLIDIMLMNLRADFRDAVIETCAIKRCVDEALIEYPFVGNDRSLVKTQCDIDFEFKGNSLLVKHVFFNFLKNSIYYVKAADKGEVTIRMYTQGGINTLSFKDTGTGIAPDILPHIFDKFYSKTKYGTGIGLAFCKSVMKSLGGDITCRSEYGAYTEFILSFPPFEKR
ncbi:MAG: HAMP domain-containing histidine kinase [Alphaproteobacteria bacterium]|nr:HAMP domain-containing histidine kinase [Alphaproteobacteria bacterium]MBX9977366.1 HAMP domain-containing histidine kinase [Alphaproteobacteria bacterium]